MILPNALVCLVFFAELLFGRERGNLPKMQEEMIIIPTKLQI